MITILYKQRETYSPPLSVDEHLNINCENKIEKQSYNCNITDDFVLQTGLQDKEAIQFLQTEAIMFYTTRMAPCSCHDPVIPWELIRSIARSNT